METYDTIRPFEITANDAETRVRMRPLLARCIDLNAVEDVLGRAEAEEGDNGPDDAPSLPREGYNAFYACIACYCPHLKVDGEPRSQGRPGHTSVFVQ